MPIPSNYTEATLMEVINNVANRLARRFKFGYHDVDDMKQQARLFAWEGLAGYNESLPLENYLWTHVRNRLFNLKRDKYERPGNPCETCDIENCNNSTCKMYNKWINHNSRKKNLMNPVDIDSVVDDNEKNMRDNGDESSDISYREMLKTIRDNLPVNSQKLFVRLQNGSKLSKAQKIKIQTEVAKILNEHGYDSTQAR